MSRVCEPMRVDATGACGCGCRLRVCNPGPTRTRDKGLMGSPGFAGQCDRVTRGCFQRKCHGPPPRKVARQCQLTLALPLRGSLVISGGKPPHRLGYPRVFVNPLPVPTKTCARGRGCGFWRVRVRVTLENPRVACDIPYACSYLILIISCLHSYFLLQTFFSFMCSLTVYM